MSSQAIKIYADKIQNHGWHIVQASPWPVMISWSLCLLPISAVIYFNSYSVPFISSSLTLVIIMMFTTLLVMYLWFRDVTYEGTLIGDHTTYVQSSITIGMILFITSEVFFFISIFWAYFHNSLSPAIELGTQWPPIGVDAINPFELPLLNTLLLLSSGATVTYSHHSLINGSRRSCIISLFLTVILAVIFTLCQSIEYYNAGFTFSDGVYGSTFYIATGFHGLHVIIGTIFLFVALIRIIYYHYTNTHHVGFESAIIYYHFVDVVWLALFVIIYWWGS